MKLDVYFGESLRVGRRLASDALMDCFERNELEVAALYRGIEGFGIGRRIHTERFPDMSTDLPLIAEAIDTRERIEGVLGEVDSIIDRGLVTLEHSRLAVGEDVRAADFPDGVGSAARLTIYCGRGERTGNVASYRAVVDLLRRHGANGATVLLGVDGMHGGARRRAGLFSRNVNVPMATIAVGAPDILQKVLSALPEVLQRPIANLERIAVVKHDGDLLEPLPMVADPRDEPPVWMAPRVYTRQSARVDGGALYTTLTRQLRRAGGAGITTLRGERGFSSDERPLGNRIATRASHVPTYTVFVDRTRKIAELWPVVDEITSQHGVVTAAFVPGYRERAGELQHCALTARYPEDIARLCRTYAARDRPQPAIPTASGRPRTPEERWTRTLLNEIADFATRHRRPQPLVRVTLADEEQFFLAALEARPGDGFVTLMPHSERVADLMAGEGDDLVAPRVLVVPLSRIARVELLAHVPRGTRSNVGFSLPHVDQDAPGT